MPALNTIPVDKLVRLIGTPKAPTIIDVRTDDDFAAEPRFIPGAVRRPWADVAGWAAEYRGKSIVVACAQGHKLSQGAAAWLRQEGADADALDGGVRAWIDAGHPLIPEAVLPARNPQGRTVWVTRARPKVDRIACPWLIRRFVDPNAMFLFVAPGEVVGVAERFGGAPFDIEGDGITWSHDGERCTFDVMLEGFGLSEVQPLAHLALIVRGADTGRPEIVPEAAGLVAMSLGLSRMYADDLEQLEAGMLLYDAFYRWCRDATGETHDWVSHQPKGARTKPVTA
ncbi:sulfurtransferase (plasmid) [Sphingobium xenophagum]|jgi:rhodanese-related sulfurtransferase|uniref:Sulfurtransferase n=1 Tax=Sphingobium xenophagum TaxID=121428 RepID=A0A249MZ34_SPHXE|nr:chromate resistance protein ChrB domain-containing protein [Sphingobium xenophagum]ASY46588.1 sulfurtransferase [Sphingobium xenophagum]ASY46831.1 sulfurtransferase [Sphingobium xenophagum]